MTSYATEPDPNATHQAPTPARRLVRTVLQTIVAVCAAVPAAVALLPLDPAEAAWPVGIAGAGVILVSAIQNGLDDVRGRG